MSELKDKIVTEIKKIYDPEIPVNIFELGLIYKIEIKDKKKVNIEKSPKIIKPEPYKSPWGNPGGRDRKR